jgi:hypothetical protein
MHFSYSINTHGRSLSVEPVFISLLDRLELDVSREKLPEQVRKPSPTSQDNDATRVNLSGPGKEAKKMNHELRFDPYLTDWAR